ncbi:MAG: response regulator [Bacteroidota bacterium]|nr:response regulator [Bacteroidota bacterium]
MVEKTILIIEDEDFIATAMSKALKNEGYNVIIVSDYKSAIKVIDGVPLNIVVSDVMLPYAGGFDILDHIKQNINLNQLPVILVTGMDKEVLLSSKVQADAIIAKPFDMKQLVDVVNSFTLVGA